MITNIYKYPQLKRTDKDAGRYYIDSNDDPVPSVTTVLSNTSNKKESIEKWRRRVGEEEANRITKKSTDIGSMVHEALELFLNGMDWDDFSDDQNGLIAKKITTKFINTGIKSNLNSLVFDFDDNNIPQPAELSIGSLASPAVFGTAVFASAVFGQTLFPQQKINLTGSGFTNNFRISSNGTGSSYTVSGFYVDYIPGGRI